MRHHKRSLTTWTLLALSAVACLGLGGWALTQMPGQNKALPAAAATIAPAPGAYIPTREPTIRLQFKPGQAPPQGRFQAWLDDREVTAQVKATPDALEWAAALPDGPHTVRVEYPPDLYGFGKYLAGFYRSRWTFTVDTSKPKLVLSDPRPEAVLSPGPLEVKGVTDPANTLVVGDQTVAVGSDGKFTAQVTLVPRKAIPITATNRAGTVTSTFVSTRRPVEVRGIYVTGWVGGMPDLLNKILAATRGTPINAVVVDLKDSTGQLTYPSKVPMAQAIGAGEKRIPDLKKVVDALEQHNLYAIARMAVFPDNVLARKHPEWMLKRPGGGVWQDAAGLAWSSPFAKPVWEYNLAIAREAAEMGFREIQFDYVRYPSDGRVNEIIVPFKDKRKKYEIVRDFLAWARQELQPYDVFVSADVYGLVTTGEDLGIGQIMKEIAKVVDYVCPMAYPSHYYTGAYGLKDPDAVPYQTVLYAMRGANKQIQGLPKAKVRPWLQWFSLRHKYGLPQINAQIKAVNDAGMAEYLLWNPYNVYPHDMLKGLRAGPVTRPSTAASPGPNVKNT